MKKIQHGQALIMMLFFALIGITVITSAVFIIITNSQGSSKVQQSTVAYSIAQSGAENAMLQLLRNPGYQGETMTIGDGTATIQVSSNSGTFTIISTGQSGNFIKKVQVTGAYQNYIINFSPIKEIYN
jgi:hypothetical protein